MTDFRLSLLLGTSEAHSFPVAGGEGPMLYRRQLQHLYYQHAPYYTLPAPHDRWHSEVGRMHSRRLSAHRHPAARTSSEARVHRHGPGSHHGHANVDDELLRLLHARAQRRALEEARDRAEEEEEQYRERRPRRSRRRDDERDREDIHWYHDGFWD